MNKLCYELILGQTWVDPIPACALHSLAVAGSFEQSCIGVAWCSDPYGGALVRTHSQVCGV